jgi:hypothetical protein
MPAVVVLLHVPLGPAAYAGLGHDHACAVDIGKTIYLGRCRATWCWEVVIFDGPHVVWWSGGLLKTHPKHWTPPGMPAVAVLLHVFQGPAAYAGLAGQLQSRAGRTEPADQPAAAPLGWVQRALHLALCSSSSSSSSEVRQKSWLLIGAAAKHGRPYCASRSAGSSSPWQGDPCTASSALQQQQQQQKVSWQQLPLAGCSMHCI